MRLVAATAGAFGLLTIGDWGQVIGLVALLVGIVVVTPSRRSIKVWKEEAEAGKAQADRLRDDLVGAQTRANAAEDRLHDAEKEIAALGREVKTLERFTAQAAMEQVGERMAHLEAAVVTAVTGQGDLTMQTHAILENLRRSLERNGELLIKLEQRIAP